MPVRSFLRRFVAVLPAAVIACSGRGTVIESRREPPASKDVPDSGSRLVAEPRLRPSPGIEAGTDAATDYDLTPKSGSRITVNGIVADGEILDVRTVEDKQRGIGCGVVNGADGVMRCLPSQDDVVFRDAACTDALLRGT